MVTEIALSHFTDTDIDIWSNNTISGVEYVSKDPCRSNAG